ncbi:MAG: N-acetylmuramoyl-L-alanine amidase [Pseudomonadota bacterium]
MNRISRWIQLLAFALVCGVSAVAEIQSVGIAGDGEYTRITLASTTPLEPLVALGGDEALGLIKVQPSHFSIDPHIYLGEPVGGVIAYTVKADHILFELEIPMMVVRELDLPPTGSEALYRYVIDLSAVSETRFLHAVRSDAAVFDAPPMLAVPSLPEAQTVAAVTEPVEAVLTEASAAAPSPKPWSLMRMTELAATQRRHTVVIDPGHGGRDPGALAVNGGQEKDIVLKTAQILKTLLEEDPRYDVRLTRETDIYVEHEDRVSMAREWGADLFISLHADAALKPHIFGASVYTISTRGERRIEGTANRFGWEIPIEDGTSEEVSGILEDLVLRETKSNSAIFAEDLVPELEKAGPLLRNTHRQGNLFVLLAPDVPAVLVEIGFLTNTTDSRRLKSSSGRTKSAQAIKRAIDTYFNRQDQMLASN